MAYNFISDLSGGGRLAQNIEYSGIVRQTGGNGIPDAEVKVTSGQSVPYVTHTDSSGVFHTVLPSSSRVIRVLVGKPGFATRTLTVDLSAGTSEDIVLYRTPEMEPTFPLFSKQFPQPGRSGKRLAEWLRNTIIGALILGVVSSLLAAMFWEQITKLRDRTFPQHSQSAQNNPRQNQSEPPPLASPKQFLQEPEIHDPRALPKNTPIAPTNELLKTASLAVGDNTSPVSKTAPINVEAKKPSVRNRSSRPTQPYLCCYLVPGWSQPVKIVYSGFPASVSEEAFLYYLRSHLRELPDSTQADYLLRLVATTELDVATGSCPNAEKITVNSDLEKLTNDAGFKTSRASASGLACMKSSLLQSEGDATNDAITKLVSALTKAPID